MMNIDRDMEDLAHLLIARNANEIGITRIIGRPAQLGHIGEFIASRIFDIELEESAVHPGSDGRFRSGPLAGKSVNIKMYGKREGVLDTCPEYLPDYYLVLTGHKSTAMSSKGDSGPLRYAVRAGVRPQQTCATRRSLHPEDFKRAKGCSRN